MNTQPTGLTEVTKPGHTMVSLGKSLLAVLKAWAQPAESDHVGMFAGSLLPYGSWAPPKGPR